MFSMSRLVVNNPSFGRSPSGFTRMHLELLPKEVSRLVGYDPRTLVMKPRSSKVARGTRDILPHNVSAAVINLQNNVQRSIDNSRVAQMVQYLHQAVEHGSFADWGAIYLVTSSEPEAQGDSKAALDPDGEYFIAEGQHRYCALLDFIREYPQYAAAFTQGVTISVMPEAKLSEWAGQAFHDLNYYSVPVRAGKALSVDTRDPINAVAKELDSHPVVQSAGGVAYERDTLLAGDTRFTSHSVIHRFTKGFLFGRSGLDKTTDTRLDIEPASKAGLWEYITLLAGLLPWREANRDEFLTRTSVVLAALSVVGHDLYHSDLSPEVRALRLDALRAVDWRRTNLSLVGVLGSEKGGLVQPASSRQAIDSTIRYMRELLGLLPTPVKLPVGQNGISNHNHS
jgi:DndB-like DNA-sulfur modification-associated protein